MTATRSRPRRRSGLELLDERQRLPDAVEVVAFVGDVDVGPHPDREHDGVELRLELRQPGRVDARAQLELDAEVREQPRLVGQRLVRLAVRRDPVTDEPADLPAIVVHSHLVAARGELAGRRETRPARRRSRRRACRSAASVCAGARRWRRPTRSRSAGARRSRSAGAPRGSARSRFDRAPRRGRRARRFRRGCSRQR